MAGWKTMALLIAAAALSGCATKSDLDNVRKDVVQTQTTTKATDDRVNGHETRLGDAEKSLAAATKQLAEINDKLAMETALLTQISKQLADLEARLKVVDGKFVAEGERMDRTDAQVAALTSAREEMKKLGGLYRKNLENMRDIYKRQFEALSEILEKQPEPGK